MLQKKCFRHYPVCLNKIDSTKKSYKLNNKEMAKIDNLLSKSKNVIGEVVNLGQLAMSNYWNNINNNIDAGIDKLMEIVEVMTVLSGVAIDNAKKSYDLDMVKEIENIRSNSLFNGKKPLFWQYVSQDPKVKKKITYYDTAMDMLAKVIDENNNKAKYIKSVDIIDLLVPQDRYNANRKQISTLIEEFNMLDNYMEKLLLEASTKEEKMEACLLIEERIFELGQKVAKRKITKESMYTMICLAVGNGQKTNTDTTLNIQKMMLNMLYKNQQELFLSAFL